MSVGERTGGGVIVDDPLYGQGFTHIPNGVVNDPDLSADAKLLYGIILTNIWNDPDADDRSATKERIAYALGCHPNDVARFRRELERAGWLDDRAGLRASKFGEVV